MTDNNEVLVKKESPKAGGTALARLENILVVDGGDSVIEGDFNAPKRIGLIILFVVFGILGCGQHWCRSAGQHMHQHK